MCIRAMGLGSTPSGKRVGFHRASQVEFMVNSFGNIHIFKWLWVHPQLAHTGFFRAGVLSPLVRWAVYSDPSTVPQLLVT